MPIETRIAIGINFDIDTLTNLNVVNSALVYRSEEHTSELQSQSNLVCRLLLEKKKTLQLNTNTPAQDSQLALGCLLNITYNIAILSQIPSSDAHISAHIAHVRTSTDDYTHLH